MTLNSIKIYNFTKKKTTKQSYNLKYLKKQASQIITLLFLTEANTNQTKNKKYPHS
jgi:hypothetical protein